MSSTFELKKGGATASVGSRNHWLLANDILPNGFPALETDTGLLKYGNGVDIYAQLPYHTGHGYATQITASAVSTLTIPLLADLHNYTLILEDITVSVDNTDLNLVVSSNNGSSWINTGYQWILKDTVSSMTVSRNTSASTFTIKTGLSNTSGRTLSGTLNIQKTTRLSYQSSFTSTISSGDLQLTEGAGMISGSITDLQLAISSGTFSGTVKVFRRV